MSAVAHNVYMDAVVSDFPSFMQMPSARAIMTAFKRTFWDHLVPEEARNFMHSMLIGRLKIASSRLPTLSTLEGHKRELLLVAICGTFVYVGHRVIASHDAAAKARDNNNKICGGISELDIAESKCATTITTTTTIQYDEKQNELLALIIDGKFGRTELLQNYIRQKSQNIVNMTAATAVKISTKCKSEDSEEQTDYDYDKYYNNGSGISGSPSLMVEMKEK